MSRNQKSVYVALAALLVIVLLIAAALQGARSQPSQAQLAEAGIILLPQGRTVPSVSMLDQQSQPMALDQPTGKWSLVFFGYTFCPDICPTTLAQLRQLKLDLPAETWQRLRVILVSVDPARDTPEQLKQYLAFFDPSFIGLTGSIEQTQTLANGLSIPFVPADTRTPGYTVSHSGNLALIGPDGRQRGFIRAPFDTAKLAARLPGLVAQE